MAAGATFERRPYDYAVLRVVPNVAREEFVNVGVVLFARTSGFLACALDDAPRIARRVSALCEPFDTELLWAHLQAVAAVCAGARDAGPIARLSQSERFHWLTTHRSTAIQSSVLHSGTCDDPSSTLARLFDAMIKRQEL